MSLLDLVLAPGGLRPAFQPILELRGGRWQLHGVECLTRGPRGTNLEAADVLFAYVRNKQAEREVDRCCVRVGLRAAEALFAALPPGLLIHLNLHSTTLGTDPGFPELLRQTASASGVPLSAIVVELLEHIPFWGTERFDAAVAELRAMGCRLALDDVGLADSNLRRIVECPVDYYKLDRYFVRDIHRSRPRAAVVESLVGLAGKLDAQVIAEGVEQLAELDLLLAMAVEKIQGRLFAGALPAVELVQWASQLTSRPMSPAPDRSAGCQLSSGASGASGATAAGPAREAIAAPAGSL